MLPVAFNTWQCATQQLDLLANVTSSTSMSAHLPGIPTLMVSCLCSTQLEMCEIILEWRRSIVAWSTPVRTCMACLGVPRGCGAYLQNRPKDTSAFFAEVLSMGLSIKYTVDQTVQCVTPTCMPLVIPQNQPDRGGSTATASQWGCCGHQSGRSDGP